MYLIYVLFFFVVVRVLHIGQTEVPTKAERMKHIEQDTSGTEFYSMPLGVNFFPAPTSKLLSICYM